MLLELKVSHFAIIDNIHINFKDGLNILSGETGAGKSVLLKSLSLLMGQKSSSDSIRTGFDQASIEGFFDIKGREDIIEKLSDLGIEIEDDLLIVRRTIHQNDKSRIYLNGTLSTLAQLKDIVSPLVEVTGHATPLIEMTGQHENKNLLSKSYHLDLLDQYCGHWDLRSKYLEKYKKMHQLKIDMVAIESDSKNKNQRIDFLIYQRDEIAKLNLSPGEDFEIENKVKQQKHLTKIFQFVDQAESTLCLDDDSATTRLQALIQRSGELAQIDPALHSKLQPLSDAKSIIDDTVYSLRQHISKMDADTDQLDKLEDRLSQIRKLQKKYGSSMNDILHAMLEIENELNHLQNSEKNIEKMKQEISALSSELFKLGEQLHKARVKEAKTLSEKVNHELSDLNMKGVTFSVHTEKWDNLASTGLTDVEFMSQTSPKDPPKALSKVSSGGELSRILLSLKSVLGATDLPRTYLFDEVDTGVSGPTAEKVGKKLCNIAHGQQVICITHLPQVAAYGDHHFYISKSPKENSISMDVQALKGKERVKEIARLISGEKITQTSLAHAEQLLKETASPR